MNGYRIDGLQYAKWSEKIFRQLRAGQVDAVHVTIAYHETFRETVANMEQWNRWFERHSDLILPGRSGDDVRKARETGRTAVFYGFQNPSPIEDDIGLVEILHGLGARFMQLSYNNQSLLATGCYESEDPGVTRMGREVIGEMNRVGLVIDMSHSAERSTLEAIEFSQRQPAYHTHGKEHGLQPVQDRPAVVRRPEGAAAGHPLLHVSRHEAVARFIREVGIGCHAAECLEIGADIKRAEPRYRPVTGGHAPGSPQLIPAIDKGLR